MVDFVSQEVYEPRLKPQVVVLTNLADQATVLAAGEAIMLNTGDHTPIVLQDAGGGRELWITHALIHARRTVADNVGKLRQGFVAGCRKVMAAVAPSNGLNPVAG